MAECGMVGGIISVCGGGEQWDKPRDDIANWNYLDKQGNGA